ncbi:MAG TPA: hypothetical protein VF614_16880 [Chthoniobacteraceae bacterium]|jgi:hypothetical protein
MAEEIKIVVKQESQGTAINDARRDMEALKRSQSSGGASGSPNDSRRQQLEARIAELNRLEKTYSEKGMSGAAASVRSERIPLNRELRDLNKEDAAERARAKIAARATSTDSKDLDRDINVAERRKSFNEQLRAREMRAGGDEKGAAALERQNAIRQRAIQLERELVISRAQAVDLATREANATGASAGAKGGGGGSRGGFFSGLGGAQAFGSVVTTMLGGVKRFFDDKLESVRASTQIASGSIESTNSSIRTTGLAGARGEDAAAAEALAAEGKLKDLESKRGTFHGVDNGPFDQLKHGLKSIGVSSLFGMDVEPDSEREERLNKEKRENAKVDAHQKRKIAGDKFAEGPGGLEIEMQERILNNDREGARVLELKAVRMREFERLRQAGASEEMQERGADIKVAAMERQRDQAVAKSIGVRSGSKDTARAAAIASGRGGGREEGLLEGIHQTMQRQHSEAVNLYPHRLRK